MCSREHLLRSPSFDCEVSSVGVPECRLKATILPQLLDAVYFLETPWVCRIDAEYPRFKRSLQESQRVLDFDSSIKFRAERLRIRLNAVFS